MARREGVRAGPYKGCSLTKEDVAMIVQLSKLGDAKGLRGYLAGMREREKRLDKKVKLALNLSEVALRDLAEADGDVATWNKGGDGYEAFEAIQEAREEFK